MSLIPQKNAAAAQGEQKIGHGNALKGGAYSLTLTLIVLAILIVVNVLAEVLPSNLTKIDISSQQLYSITSNTKVVVNNLEKDVTVYWITQDGEEDSIIENLLDKYDALSDYITVTKINPDEYPTFTTQYTDETVSNNSIIVVSGDKSRYIAYDDIYLTDIDYDTYSYVYSFDGEGQITSAISYVVSEDLPKLYVLEGHGESELPDSFSSEIVKENMETESFSLLNEDEIPEDADAIVIYAPTSDISEDEKDILADYVADGGKLFVCAGPIADGELTNLYALLSDYGIEAVEGIVIEGDRDYYALSSPYILLPELGTSDITSPLADGNYYVNVPIATGLQVGSSSATVTELLSTSGDAFSKVAGYSLTSYDKEDGDIDGPFDVAVSVVNDTEGEMIWVTSSYFLEDDYNSYSSGANLNFAMNALSELVGNDSESSVIRSKSLGYNYLSISSSTSTMLEAVMIGILPGFFVVLGIAVMIVRRSRRK